MDLGSVPNRNHTENRDNNSQDGSFEGDSTIESHNLDNNIQDMSKSLKIINILEASIPLEAQGLVFLLVAFFLGAVLDQVWWLKNP